MLYDASPTAIAFLVDVHTLSLPTGTFEGLYAPATPEPMFATAPLPNATVSARLAFAPLPIAAEFVAAVSVTPPNAAKEFTAFAVAAVPTVVLPSPPNAVE